jgi:hypothetical protein
MVSKNLFPHILIKSPMVGLLLLLSSCTPTPQQPARVESLPKHQRLIVLSCGNLGGAEIFPRLIGSLYEHISRTYHTKLREITTKHGGIYVDLFDERDSDPFVREPEVYLAPDYFHPSSRGYEYWFGKVEARLEESMK